MRFEVEHLTNYNYDEPVTLGMQTVRLRPRQDGGIRELGYSLLVDPAPVLRRERLDAEGNLATRMWFEAETRHLRIVSRFTVDTLETDPFGLVLDTAYRALPVIYPPEETDALARYRTADHLGPSVRTLSEDIAARSDGDPLAFLAVLNDRLHREIEREIREEGPPQSPAQTLARGRGACRDQAVLFISLCRAAGFAARFVSGYQDRSAMDTPERHLHAWPEVYIPGCGWSGLDPTRGIAVGATHVAIAAAPGPAGAMPVEGSYFGSAASRLSFDVRIKTSL
jgi:transglutaminase-like putative cysteine protease